MEGLINVEDYAWTSPMYVGAGFLKKKFAHLPPTQHAYITIFFSLLYDTPAPSVESQHPEAWPARTFERC